MPVPFRNQTIRFSRPFVTIFRKFTISCLVYVYLNIVYLHAQTSATWTPSLEAWKEESLCKCRTQPWRCRSSIARLSIRRSGPVFGVIMGNISASYSITLPTQASCNRSRVMLKMVGWKKEKVITEGNT